MHVIRGHFSLRINPFLLPTLVLLQSNAPRVASKQFYVYACRSNCHRWNLMGIFSSNKVEVSTYWFEYTLTTFMGVKHFYRASNVAYKQQQQFWSISPKTIPARGHTQAEHESRWDKNYPWEIFSWMVFIGPTVSGNGKSKIFYRANFLFPHFLFPVLRWKICFLKHRHIIYRWKAFFQLSNYF